MSEFEKPFVSVIVPCYNGEKTIGACLGSLLNQTYPKDRTEIIAVDNGSADKTAEIIRAYPVKYVHEGRKRSSYAARNAGLRQASGEIIAFTDADCVVSPTWITEGITAFEEDGVVGVAGRIRGFEPETRVEEYLIRRDPVKHSVENKFLPFAVTANVFYRRDIFKKIGRFEEWTSGGDADFSWRVQLAGYRMKFIPQADVFHRHRSTTKGMFKQFMKFGYGNAQLTRKYRDFLGTRARGLRNTITRSKKEGAAPVARGPVHYDVLTAVGWKIGKLAGSVRYALS